MTYYYLTRNDKKRKDRVDGMLARAMSTWNRERMQAMKREVVSAAPSKPSTVEASTVEAPQPSKLVKRRGLPQPPPGWGSDAEASRSSMMAAKMLKKPGGG